MKRHFLIRSNDGEWAEDQQGRQWVKRPRDRFDPACSGCLFEEGNDGKGAGPIWYAFFDQGGGRPNAVAVCEKHCEVHWPLNIPMA